MLLDLRNQVILRHKKIAETDVMTGLMLMNCPAFQKCLNMLDPECPYVVDDAADALIAYFAAIGMVDNPDLLKVRAKAFDKGSLDEALAELFC